MKWSGVVAIGFAVTAVGLFLIAVMLLAGQPLWGFVITAFGLSISAIGGAMHFAERR
ncbi:hypothetical protein [Microbacterium maritypicum]